MSDPYRSEDPVAKLQAENEKLRQENDRLMWRFSSLRKWPIVAVLVFGNLCLILGTYFFLGNSTKLEDGENEQGWKISGQIVESIVRNVYTHDLIAERVSTMVSASLRSDLQSMIRAELDRQNTLTYEEICLDSYVCRNETDDPYLDFAQDTDRYH